MQLAYNRCRFAMDTRKPRETVVDQLSGEGLVLWKGTDTQFEFLLTAADQILDVTNLASVTITIKYDADRQGTILFTQTLGQADLHYPVLQSDWDAGTNQHGIFTIDATSSNFFITPNSTEISLFLIISANTGAGKSLVLGTAALTLLGNAFPGGDTNPPSIDGNLIPPGEVYDIGSAYGPIVVTAGKLYRWAKGAHEVSLINGMETLTTSGTFTAQGSSVTLNGTGAGVDVTAWIGLETYLTQDEADARYSGISSLQTQLNALTARMDAMTFDDVADLRANTVHADRREYQVLGNAARGDGFAMRYYYDASSNAADNGSSVIKPTDVSGAGRYLQLTF